MKIESFVGRPYLRPALISVLLSAGGCVAPVPPSDPIPHIAAATGVADVRVVSIGRPDDEPDPVGDLLTVDEAARRAVTGSPRVQAAVARVRAALADAEQARLLPNPVLTVAVRYPAGGGEPTIDAGLSADLLSVLQRGRRSSAADHRLRAAAADAVTTALDVLAGVGEKYAVVQSLDARSAVLAERRRVTARLLALADARLRAGEAGRLDVLALESERAALEVEAIEKAGDRRDARLELARLIGRPSDAAEFAVTPWEPVVIAPVDEAAWVAAALRKRPEVQAQVWELAALGDEAALAGMAFLDGTGAGVDSERDGAWTVGPAASVPVPVFDWGQQRRARAEAARVEARHELTQARRQVIEEVRRAVASLRSAQAGLAKVRGELVPLAERRRDQAEASYRQGLADVTAVLLAEQDAQATRSHLVEAEQRAAVARYRLVRAVGGPPVAAALLAVPTTRPAATQP